MPEFDDAERWFASAGWQPFAFQREVWAAMSAGRSGLLHATTGAGKTYAMWIGALLRAPALAADAPAAARGTAPRLGVMWLTPMRALAADTTRALALPLPALAPAWTVGMRTGDTAAAERARQDRRLPTALVTTPESLTLMLTRESARERQGAEHRDREPEEPQDLPLTEARGPRVAEAAHVAHGARVEAGEQHA